MRDPRLRPQESFLFYASRFSDKFDAAAGFGWTLSEKRLDWISLISAKDKEISRLEAAYRATLDKFKVMIFPEHAACLSPNEVRLSASGRTISAKAILIAMGRRATRTSSVRMPGIEHVITSNEVIQLTELPRRIIIACGGDMLRPSSRPSSMALAPTLR